MCDRGSWQHCRARGEHVDVNLAMTFKPAFSGAKNVYLYGAAGAGKSGWQDRGDWTVATVTADSATPSSGTGGTQTFALQYSSTAGATSVSEAWVWFNATFADTAANSCLVSYERPTNALRLLDDAGTTWMRATLGTAATLENSRCAIVVGGSHVALAGNTLTVNLAMTFKASYAGAKNVYIYGAAGGAASGWQDRGDWTVPVGAALR